MKKIAKIVMPIVVVLMCAILAVDVYEFYTGESFLPTALSLIGTLCAIYYAFFGYKTPKGNMMKYLFFIYGIAIGLYGIYRAALYVPSAYCYFLTALIVVYISGRLDKLEKNTYLIILAFILAFVGYVIKCFIKEEIFIDAIRHADELYILISLYAFYFVRYAEHKKAGAKLSADTEQAE